MMSTSTDRFSVLARLMISFGALAMLTGLIGGVGIWAFARMTTTFQTVATQDVPALLKLEQAQSEMHQVILAERSLLFMQTATPTAQETLKKHAEHLAQLDVLWQQYITLNKAKIAPPPAFEKALAAWANASRDVLKILSEDTPAARRDAVDLSLSDAAEKYNQVLNALRQMTQQQVLSLSERVKQEHLMANQMEKMIFIFVVGTFGLAGGLAIWLARWVGGPLRQIMVAARTQELNKANALLFDQSNTDSLTQLKNRRFLETTMQGMSASTLKAHRANQHKNQPDQHANQDLALLMIDVDHFKRVNDEFGHHAGDLVLQQIAQILQKAARDSDTVVRWGGEEFLIVASNVSRHKFPILVERIRADVENHHFNIDAAQPIRLTCSVGFAFFPWIAQHPEACSWEYAASLADYCLYLAKNNGRNTWAGICPASDFKPEERPINLASDIPPLIEQRRLIVLLRQQSPDDSQAVKSTANERHEAAPINAISPSPS
ncbi:GGDEF domain-containing protein [Deefgea piscis]|uniref:GGDEF domain-containing protein n=1 Tax=Deefgea piscis TaxID=2739061 RepID=UPI001C81CD50|nr:diguanylate cyclase [Deefgea piscis]QZA80378.1 diguanylate cyclase [Deefgea piscis]